MGPAGDGPAAARINVCNTGAGLNREAKMKKILACAVRAVCLVSAHACAQQRVVDSGLGAVSGGVLFGPVGLIAGGVVGYTAGPSVARAWGSADTATIGGTQGGEPTNIQATLTSVQAAFQQKKRPLKPQRLISWRSQVPGL